MSLVVLATFILVKNTIIGATNLAVTTNVGLYLQSWKVLAQASFRCTFVYTMCTSKTEIADFIHQIDRSTYREVAHANKVSKVMFTLIVKVVRFE